MSQLDITLKVVSSRCQTRAATAAASSSAESPSSTTKRSYASRFGRSAASHQVCRQLGPKRITHASS